MFVNVQDVSVILGGKIILDNISFHIGKAERIGLVGKNGAGKTTLLKVLSGQLKPDEGKVTYPGNFKIGYLPQEISITSDLTVYEETRTAFGRLLEIESRLEQLQSSIQQYENHSDPEYLKLLDEFARLQEEYNMLDGYQVDAKIWKVLSGLGFERDELSVPVKDLSGGWQMRVFLAKLLLDNPDLLLLDEPTNHLDIESIVWLENYLKEFPGMVILISHDRAFLDNITTRTIEITRGRIEDYRAPYSKYLEMRSQRREQLIAARKNQQQQIKQMERNIERFRYKSTKARFAQSLIRKLDKMEIIEVEPEDVEAMKIRFPEIQRSGKWVVSCKNLSKSFGDKEVLRNLNFDISRGERIAFVGKNGMGKSTLSKILAGKLDYQGELHYGHNVVIGYYAQDQAENLDAGKTVLETLEDVANHEMRPRVRTLLGAFLFSGDDVYKKVSVLSGGEKARLSLAKMLLEPVNLLILDEPTNHLDILSKKVLKKALRHFPGTLIVVSHDRDFLDGLTSRVFEFRKLEIKDYFGSIRDFLQSRNLSSFRNLEIQGNKPLSGTGKQETRSGRSFFEKKKELERAIRKLHRKVQKLEDTLNEVDNELERLEKALQNPGKPQDIPSGVDIFARYGELKALQKQLLDDWESGSVELEKLQKELSSLLGK